MFKLLKNHPFAVKAFFQSSIVLTFAVVKDQLQKLIPEHLELDTFQDKWAFVTVAMVQTRGLRPKGFPEWMGNDFFLLGYRVFVRYNSKGGKNLRGLYILKSETDKIQMEIIGNIFTHYNYSTTDIIQSETENILQITSEKSAFKVIIDKSKSEIKLPPFSPFTDWKEARRYAGPLPFTFTYNSIKKEMLIIEGVRQNWNPLPVCIVDCNFNFLNSLNLTNPVLANAFQVTNVPYGWKKGEIEKWSN